MLAKPDMALASKLVRDLSEMIEAAQKQVAAVANVALTALHWQIGHHVRTQVLEGHRAEYGGQIVSTASRQLAERYGRGFNEKSVRHMVQFATAFPDREIVSTAWRQLTWSHFKTLAYLKDPIARGPAAVSRLRAFSTRRTPQTGLHPPTSSPGPHRAWLP